MYLACLAGSVVKGWKPRRAAWATCGSVRRIVGGGGVDGPGVGMSDVEAGAKRLAVMFLIRFWSFLEMKSKMDLVAEGRGVSPSAAPRCSQHVSM